MPLANASAALWVIAEVPEFGIIVHGGLACSLGLTAAARPLAAPRMRAPSGALDIGAAVNVCLSGGSSGRAAILPASGAQCSSTTASGSSTPTPCALPRPRQPSDLPQTALHVVVRVLLFNTATCVDSAVLAAIALSCHGRGVHHCNTASNPCQCTSAAIEYGGCSGRDGRCGSADPHLATVAIAASGSVAAVAPSLGNVVRLLRCPCRLHRPSRRPHRPSYARAAGAAVAGLNGRRLPS